MGPGYEQETRSNGTWSLQLYHVSDGKGLMIFMGIVTGKYAGAGFVVSVINTQGELVAKNIQCAERKTHGTIFEGDPGDYCTTIMNGTLVPEESGTYDVYNLP